MWLVQVLALTIILMLRRAMSSSVDGMFEEGEDEEQEERAASDQRKQLVKMVFTIFACIVVLLIFQEMLLAVKLEGHIDSWLLVLIPYLIFETLWLFVRVRVAVAGPPGSVGVLMLPFFAWGVTRFCTWILFVLKADGSIEGSWIVCLIPLMIAVVIRLIWAGRPVPPSAPATEEDEPPSSNGFTGICIAMGCWLSILVLAAKKLDGLQIPAFLVFLPYFLIAAIVLSCCTCLACCGPNIIRAALNSEFEEQGLNTSMPTTANGTNSTTPPQSRDYSTMAPASSSAHHPETREPLMTTMDYQKPGSEPV